MSSSHEPPTHPVVEVVDSVEDSAPETIDKAAVPAVPASAAAAQAAAAVVAAATAAAGRLVEVAMEAFTTVMDMEEIITPIPNCIYNFVTEDNLFVNVL